MRRLALIAILLVVLTSTATPPSPTKTLTHPVTPAKAELDRLNLQLAWSLNLPAYTAQNGIGVIQHIGNQLYIQLRDGTIHAIDAETGKVDWTKRVGNVYPVTRRLGYDADLVFAMDVNRLIALEKKDGHPRWMLDLPDVPVTPPMAGEYLLYVPFSNGRVLTYALPETTVKVLEKDKKERVEFVEKVNKFRRKIAAAAPLAPTGVNLLAPRAESTRSSTSSNVSSRTATTSMALHKSASYATTSATATELADAALQPYFLSSRSPGFRVDNPVLVSSVGILLTGNSRETLTIRRDPENPIYKFTAATPLSIAPVQYGNTAYFACTDGAIYAVDLVAGRIEWQMAAAAPLREPMIVTDTGLFANMHHRGLMMIDRVSGNTTWFQPDAHTILAVSGSYVYANDRVGRLLILDRVTGTVLSQLDLSPYNVPFVNEHNDRIILSANDGSVICLHDRGQVTPLVHEAPKVAAPKLLDKAAGQGK